MESLEIHPNEQTRGETKPQQICYIPNPVPICKVKTQFSPKHNPSSTDLADFGMVSSDSMSIACSWEKNGKADFQDSSELKIPSWIADVKSEHLAYAAMKQFLKILTDGSMTSIEAYAECLECLAYCSLFPKGYEIEGDELLQLWMAAGLIEKEPMECIGVGYLGALHEFLASVFSFSREDSSTGKKWYKVNKQILSSRLSLVRVDYSHDPVEVLSAKKEPFHATFTDLSSDLDFLCRFTGMRTLLLLKGHGSSNIDHVPHGFFMSLKLLQALDLSGTKVSELPSSIGHAKCLRYLEFSQTLIKRLPETIDCLSELQTLKLRNCPRLVALPKTLSRVTSLRHLDLGTLCHLRSMPPKIGELTSLYTLSNFVVGRETGCHIGELNSMNNLMGRVCLSRLEHIGSLDDAKKANLHRKRGITKLELRWTDDLEWENIGGFDGGREEVIEYLMPSIMLQELRILCYGGSKFPSWISKPSFYMLKSITLFKCENCQLLPSLGKLPSLVFLSLIELVQVKIIDVKFYTDIETAYEDYSVAFPKLEKLEIKSLLSLEEWRDMFYFPCLTKLVIKDCPQLATLCQLSNMRCLVFLEIKNCGKLTSLPEGGLPASMKTFAIDGCPLLSLNSRSLLEKTQDWHIVEDTFSLIVYQRNEGE